MFEIPFWTTEPMSRKKLDNKGQGSAELILLVGGIIIIVLLVGSYMSNITNKTQSNLKELLKQERDYLINNM